MESGLKDSLVEMVKASTAVLNDEDAMEIVQVCKRAADREIAEATERYLEEAIREEGSE